MLYYHSKVKVKQFQITVGKREEKNTTMITYTTRQQQSKTNYRSLIAKQKRQCALTCLTSEKYQKGNTKKQMRRIYKKER